MIEMLYMCGKVIMKSIIMYDYYSLVRKKSGGPE